MRVTKQEFNEALDTLRRCYPVGSTVFTIQRSRARSGMSRLLTPVSILADKGKAPVTLWPIHAVSVVCGYTRKGDALLCKGCGYDAGVDMASRIRRALGYALGHQAL